MIARPGTNSSLLSGSFDGNIKSTEFNLLNSNMFMDFDDNQKDVIINTELVEPATITSFDVHSETRTVIASTNLGGIWIKDYYYNNY